MKLPLIINLRGNSGSGKTYTTRLFLARGKRYASHRVAGANNDDTVFILNGAPWVILGKYTNACGGCDTIKTQQDIIDRVEFYMARKYNVWLEGLIMSTIYGSVGEYSEKFGDRWIFAYLMPPIDVCIERIYARRAVAGNTKPLNENNTRNRVHSIESSRLRCIDNGRRVVDLDWHNPLPQILKIIKKEAM